MLQRLLLKNTPADVLVTPYRNTSARQELLSFPQQNTEIPFCTVWITQIEQIHQFVQQIPDLAWELMEYATEPLSLVYTRAKPWPGERKVLTEVCVRLLTHPKALKLLGSNQPWISVETDHLMDKKQGVAWTEKEVDCFDARIAPQKLKIMRVYDDDSFTFLQQ
ncbi:MAG: hypothetical protein RIG62_06235 [Cyclobacteriaceae bacterium]